MTSAPEKIEDPLSLIVLQTMKELIDTRFGAVGDQLKMVDRLISLEVSSLKDLHESSVQTINAKLAGMEGCATKIEVHASNAASELRIRSLEDRVTQHVRTEEFRGAQESMIDRISKIENRLAESAGSTRITLLLWGVIALVIAGVLTAVIIPALTK